MPPVAPSWEAKVKPLMKPRSARPGGTCNLQADSVPVKLTIEVVTPIYGGGVETRKIDGVNTIRVPTIRGHLRFWWRALHAHLPDYNTADKLYAADLRSGAAPPTTPPKPVAAPPSMCA